MTNGSYYVDAELVERVTSKIKRGKAAGLNNITSEHLQFSHPLLTLLSVILSIV